MRAILLFLTTFVFIYAVAAQADTLQCQPSSEPFARGYCKILHSTNPEGWLRGKASVDRDNGKVKLVFEIETDSAIEAPKGKMKVSLLNQSGEVLATFNMGEDARRGGKSCGIAETCGRTAFELPPIDIPINVAKAVKSFDISIRRTGKAFSPMNIIELTNAVTVNYELKMATIDTNGKPGLTTLMSQSEPLASYKIVGGDSVPLGNYPWMAALYRRNGGEWVQLCGGTLLSKRWVLTAAHCRTDKNWRVVLGRTNLMDTSRGEVYSIEAVWGHPNYSPTSHDNDIALLKLDRDSQFETISIVKADLRPNTQVVVAGWGAIQEKGPPAVELRRVGIEYIADSVCEADYPGEITENMFCAGNIKGGKDSCQGDSGGPLFFQLDLDPGKFQQIGIVSWGGGCARPNKPGVYTRLAKYNDWIASILNAEK